MQRGDGNYPMVRDTISLDRPFAGRREFTRPLPDDDITFLAGGLRFYCQKQAMLNVLERGTVSRTFKTNRVIKVDGVRAHSFHDFLGYVHGQTIRITAENILDLVHVSRKFKVFGIESSIQFLFECGTLTLATRLIYADAQDLFNEKNNILRSLVISGQFADLMESFEWILLSDSLKCDLHLEIAKVIDYNEKSRFYQGLLRVYFFLPSKIKNRFFVPGVHDESCICVVCQMLGINGARSSLAPLAP